jgi:hypothetical protein
MPTLHQHPTLFKPLEPSICRYPPFTETRPTVGTRGGFVICALQGRATARCNQFLSKSCTAIVDPLRLVCLMVVGSFPRFHNGSHVNVTELLVTIGYTLS